MCQPPNRCSCPPGVGWRNDAGLPEHLAPRALAIPGLLLVSGVLLILTRLTPDGPYGANILPALILFGLGVGSLVAPSMSTATSGGDPRDAGVASAFVNASQQIGASIRTALLNTIAASAALSYLAAPLHNTRVPTQATVHGYAVACAWGAGIVLVGAIVTGALINAGAPRAKVAAPPGS